MTKRQKKSLFKRTATTLQGYFLSQSLIGIQIV